MDQQRWHKIEAILDQALTLENRSEEKAFIQKACKNDEQLYREVTSLLQSVHNAKENGFLE